VAISSAMRAYRDDTSSDACSRAAAAASVTVGAR